MTESPDELPYAYKEKLREDPDIYPAFLAAVRTVSSSMPAKASDVNGPIVPWLYPENYITLKRYPTDVGMLHLKEK